VEYYGWLGVCASVRLCICMLVCLSVCGNMLRFRDVDCLQVIVVVTVVTATVRISVHGIVKRCNTIRQCYRQQRLSSIVVVTVVTVTACMSDHGMPRCNTDRLSYRC
jgi:hypothetical protein